MPSADMTCLPLAHLRALSRVGWTHKGDVPRTHDATAAVNMLLAHNKSACFGTKTVSPGNNTPVRMATTAARNPTTIACT